jgi:hypothetical protein
MVLYPGGRVLIAGAADLAVGAALQGGGGRDPRGRETTGKNFISSSPAACQTKLECLVR